MRFEYQGYLLLAATYPPPPSGSGGAAAHVFPPDNRRKPLASFSGEDVASCLSAAKSWGDIKTSPPAKTAQQEAGLIEPAEESFEMEPLLLPPAANPVESIPTHALQKHISSDCRTPN